MNPNPDVLLGTTLGNAEVAALALRRVSRNLHTTPLYRSQHSALREASDTAEDAVGRLCALLEAETGNPDADADYPPLRDGPPCGSPVCSMREWCHRCAPRTAQAAARIAELMHWWGVPEGEYSERHVRILRALTGRGDDE